MEGYQLYRQGRASLDLERIEEALRLLTASLAIDEHFRTHGLLAETHTRLGNDVEAFFHSERAYALSPVNDAASVDFAERLAARGEQARALVIVQQTLARNSRYGPAQVLLVALGGA
jgi:tetratricopeptide (TPR) repeat protein